MNIIDLMYKYRLDCPNFICEMWPQLRKHCPSGKKKDNPIAIIALSMHILQSFEEMSNNKIINDTKRRWEILLNGVIDNSNYLERA